MTLTDGILLCVAVQLAIVIGGCVAPESVQFAPLVTVEAHVSDSANGTTIPAFQ
jgi:hypothetical protein